jgi:hypothetical protein
MGTGGPFPGIKCGRGVKLTAHPHLAPRSRVSRSYTSFCLSACMASSGTLYFHGVHIRITHSPDDGSNTHLWNVGQHPIKNTAVHSRRLWVLYSPPSELEISHLKTSFLCKKKIKLKLTELKVISVQSRLYKRKNMLFFIPHRSNASPIEARHMYDA